MDLETQRLENLRQKQKLLDDLKLEARQPFRNGKLRAQKVATSTSTSGKRRRLRDPLPPSRTSARIASGIKPSYKEDVGEKYNYVENNNRKKKTASKVRTKLEGDEANKDILNDQRSLVPVADVDEIQAGWKAWQPTGSPPVRDEDGTFHFNDFEMFTPNKSPEEMIREGAFGGSYFRPLKSRRLGIIVEGDWKELPSDWIGELNVNKYLVNPDYDPDANKFKVACGQSIEEWEAAGWIAHEFDVRGWYQWYCRFWMGRRCDDDDRQVSRWAKCVGPRGRWRRLLLKKYVQMGVKDVFDYGDEDDEEGTGKEVSPVMHQTCHHWAFEVRQRDLDEAWKEFG